MIKSLITALALSTLCIPQVQASSFTENDLLAQFEDMGGRVYVDSQLCKDNPGVYGLAQGASVHLCTEPHKGDTAEWKDTIRHEVFHIAQFCNQGPFTSNAAQAIAEAYKEGWSAGGYKPDHWHMEAEAFFVAATFTPEEIRDVLVEHCS